MKRGRIVLFALCLVVFCIGCWQAYSQSGSQSNIRPDSQAPSASSSKPIAQSIQRVKDNGGAFLSVSLFAKQAQSVSKAVKAQVAEVETLQRAVDDGMILDLNRRQMRHVLRDNLDAITLALPTAGGGTTDLELIKADLYSPDFKVETSAGENPGSYEKGVHYRGIVKGDAGSVAAISVFSNEVTGFYSMPEGGNVVLGRLGGANPKNRHILYAERDLKRKQPFACGTPDDHNILPLSAIQPQAAPFADKRIRIYVEADFNLFQNRGSATSVFGYVASFFNQSATLYSNEGIPIVLSGVYIWTSASPYNGATAGEMLSQFQSFRTSFGGDLGNLVSLRSNLGGIAAGFSGFCNADTAQRECFSGIDPTFNNVPTYSETVEVFTHEMGHLMGSPHTHACVWNGNGTAIDGCAGATEGGCPLPGIPSGGGTIMSYCHLTSAGINFANGFGPQPGSVIRNQFSNAACLIEGVPFYRYRNSSVDVHFYTTNEGFLGTGVSGWILEGVQCYVHSSWVANTVPLYRYVNTSFIDYFYTQSSTVPSGYTLGGIECYVYSTQVTGTVPLYRYANTQTHRHFYTTNFNELGSGTSGYAFEGVACYVLP
jgi:Metallo-peptidase family M12/Repeat of unknown function (DUF5648)